MRLQEAFDDGHRPLLLQADDTRDSEPAGRLMNSPEAIHKMEVDENSARQTIVSRYALSANADASNSSLSRVGESNSKTDGDNSAAFPLLIPSLPDYSDTVMLASSTSEARSSSLRPRTLARPKDDAWLLNTSESRPVVDSKMIYESPATIQQKRVDVAASGTPLVPVAENAYMPAGRRLFDFRTPTKHSLRPRPRKELSSNNLGPGRALHQQDQRRQHLQEQGPMLPFLSSPRILPQPLHMMEHQQPSLLTSPRILPRPLRMTEQQPQPPLLSSPRILPQPLRLVEPNQPPVQQSSRHNQPRIDSQQCESNGIHPMPSQPLPRFPNF